MTDSTPDEPVPPQQSRTWTREFPADWPAALCAAAMLVDLSTEIDLRRYRHHPQIPPLVWTVRRVAERAYRALLSAHTGKKQTPDIRNLLDGLRRDWAVLSAGWSERLEELDELDALVERPEPE